MIKRVDPYCYMIAVVACLHHSSTDSDTHTHKSQMLATHADTTDSEGVRLDFQSYQHQS